MARRKIDGAWLSDGQDNVPVRSLFLQIGVQYGKEIKITSYDTETAQFVSVNNKNVDVFAKKSIMK